MSFDDAMDAKKLAQLTKFYSDRLDQALKNGESENSDQWIEFNQNRLSGLPKMQCLNCMYSMTQLRCKQAGGIVPPPEVQKIGCELWLFDEIPF